MEDKLISIVVPCYNESETICEFYRRISELANRMDANRFEFIFINDGSTDDTYHIINRLAANDDRVKALHLAQNRGHQIALSAGMDYAMGNMIVNIDADLQDPPELIIKMLEKIEEGFDVVHAQRLHREGESRFKLTTASLYYRILRWLSKTPIIEDCADFRAFTRPVLEAVLAFRTPHKFLRGTFVQVGFRQCTIQYNRDTRYAGETKYPFTKMMHLAIDGILSLSATPIKSITWLAFIMWSISLIYMVTSLYNHFILNITVPGWTSIIVLMFFFTGLILLCMAIIGSYIGRIFQQGQQQPLYWIYDTRNLNQEKVNTRAAHIREVELSQRISENN